MDMKDLVDDKILEVYIKAQEKLHKTFNLPDVKYNPRMKSIGGLAFCQKNLIQLNQRMMERNGKWFVNEVVPHEVVHLIEYILFKKTKHHKRFYELGKLLGYDLRRCHNFPVVRKISNAIFVCKCRLHSGFTVSKANRIREFEQHDVYRCKHCKATLKFVR